MSEMVYSEEAGVKDFKSELLLTSSVTLRFISEWKLSKPEFCNGKKITEVCFPEELRYTYAIVNVGRSHPACYIRIPDTSVFTNAFMSKINGYEFFDDYADVHGGFTYLSKEFPPILFKGLPNGLWIGWDYAHFGDYSFGHDGYKYTVEELKVDVLFAIDQLFKSERKIVSGQYDRRLLEDD